VATNNAYRVKELILVIEARYLNALGAVRAIPGLRAATEDDGNIWLRGIMPAQKQDVRLSSLPVLISHEVDSENRLFPAGGLTPTGLLKDLDWQPIKIFIPVTTPVSALPGQSDSRLPLRLARSGQSREDFALLTDLETWKAYADTAPYIRLRMLSFAVSASGQTLITGSPLPVIKGQGYWRSGQMLLPAGYDFDPPAVATLLAASLGADKQNFFLFNADGNYQPIPLTDFVPARRSAVRLTQAG
jgi:hypothetical protein